MELARHRQGLEVSAAVVAGVVTAAATLAVDRVVELPFAVSIDNARGLLAASFGALVTAGAFAFWMLPVAAQLAASSVPPPAVAGHLHDRFQRRVIAATLGALAYTAVTVLGLPSGDGAAAPTLATVTGGVLGVAAIGMLLVAMQHAVRSTRPSGLLAEAAGEVVEQIRSRLAPATFQRAEPGSAIASDRGGVPLPAPSTGWVGAVDDAGLLDALPDRTTAVLDVGVGSFVIRGWTRVLTLHGPPDVDDDEVRALGQHLTIQRERPADQDLGGSITQFSDIAVHAAMGSSGAPSIVYEAIRYLGAILHELASHDVAVVERRSDDGRMLVWASDPAPTLAFMAVDRIRQETAWHPAMALELVATLVGARDHAARDGREELAAVLDEQADLVVSGCRHANPLPSDLERVVAKRGSSSGIGGRPRP